MLLPHHLLGGANGTGSGTHGFVIPIPAVPSSGVPNPYLNGVAPHAPDIRATGDLLNTLLARRGRVLFTDHVLRAAWYASADATDRDTLRFACHTGPLAERVRIVMVGYPAASLAASDSYAYWSLETGLTGSGTVTTGSNIYASGTYSAHAADNFRGPLTQELAVSPDTHYRFTLHQVNAFAVASVAVFEVQRSVLDTSQDSPMINVSRIAQGQPISATTALELVTAATALWRRGGHPLFAWSWDGTAGYEWQSDTATPTNILDGTTAAAATTLGFPIAVPYAGAVNSSAVAVVFYAYASVTPGEEGAIQFRNQAGSTLATITVTDTTDTWYSTTGNLADFRGAPQTTRIEVYAYLTVTGAADALTIKACGAFMYTA